MFTVGEAVHMWEQGVHESSILSAQFCFENEKSSEKIKFILKRPKKVRFQPHCLISFRGLCLRNNQQSLSTFRNVQSLTTSIHLQLLHWPKLQKWVDVRGSSWLSHSQHHFLQFTLHRALELSQLHHTFGESRPPMTLLVFTLLPPELIGPLIQAGSPRFCILESLWGFTAPSHSLLTTLQRKDAINLREKWRQKSVPRERRRDRNRLTRELISTSVPDALPAANCRHLLEPIVPLKKKKNLCILTTNSHDLATVTSNLPLEMQGQGPTLDFTSSHKWERLNPFSEWFIPCHLQLLCFPDKTLNDT